MDAPKILTNDDIQRLKAEMELTRPSRIKYEDRPDFYRKDYTEYAYDIVCALECPSNWKNKTFGAFQTPYEQQMLEVTKLLNAQNGGSEVKYSIGEYGEKIFIITSKGYYYYIGS
jgi:hypothetical protein